MKWLYRLLNKLLIFSIGAKIVPAESITLSRGSIDRLLYFGELFRRLERVEGSVVECGVSGGTSFVALCILGHKWGRYVWGFDSFKGLPTPTEKDLSSWESRVRTGQFRANLETARNTLRVGGIEMKNVTLIEGVFSQTLPAYGGTQIALLHIDADLYESYKVCLENLWAKVAIGGVVAFDEYGTAAYPGARKAVDEFFNGMGIRIHQRLGKYYVIKGKG